MLQTFQIEKISKTFLQIGKNTKKEIKNLDSKAIETTSLSSCISLSWSTIFVYVYVFFLYMLFIKNNCAFKMYFFLSSPIFGFRRDDFGCATSDYVEMVIHSLGTILITLLG